MLRKNKYKSPLCWIFTDCSEDVLLGSGIEKQDDFDLGEEEFGPWW